MKKFSKTEKILENRKNSHFLILILNLNWSYKIILFFKLNNSETIYYLAFYNNKNNNYIS